MGRKIATVKWSYLARMSGHVGFVRKVGVDPLAICFDGGAHPELAALGFHPVDVTGWTSRPEGRPVLGETGSGEYRVYNVLFNRSWFFDLATLGNVEFLEARYQGLRVRVDGWDRVRMDKDHVKATVSSISLRELHPYPLDINERMWRGEDVPHIEAWRDVRERLAADGWTNPEGQCDWLERSLPIHALHLEVTDPPTELISQFRY